MSTRPQAAIEAGDTLTNLVDQFTDQFAFLRELIQNSMDAGSTRVDVDFEFRPYENPAKGILILHVDDTGEGMNREIIDTQLTRLFSSSKENDLTKIGKFGIGFVSVFALRPTAVIVDTGRDGENWRIFFKEDRSFDRIVLDRPVDGTQIQLIKEIEATEFDRIRQRSRDTIVYWCKHSEVEIYVEGELINQSFALDHPYAVTHESQGTTVVAAPSLDERPYFGFYNRGLTLSEGHEAQLPGVAFKIKSRYLEHTLTRDNVLQDENYEKAMALLRDTVNSRLRPMLFQLARDLPTGPARDEVFGYLAFRLHKLPDGLASLNIIPCLHGRSLTIKALKKAAAKAKEVFWDDQESRVSGSLLEQNAHVIHWSGPEAAPGLGRLLEAILGKIPLRRACKTYAQPVVVKQMSDEDQALLEASARILNKAGSPYRSLVPADFDYPGSGINDELYLVQHTAGELQRLDGKPRHGLLGFLFGKALGKVLLVNIRHPLIEPHFRLRAKHPALAAYLLAKAVTLDDGLDPVTEAKLVEAALDEEETVGSRAS